MFDQASLSTESIDLHLNEVWTCSNCEFLPQAGEAIPTVMYPMQHQLSVSCMWPPGWMVYSLVLRFRIFQTAKISSMLEGDKFQCSAR